MILNYALRETLRLSTAEIVTCWSHREYWKICSLQVTVHVV